MPERGLVQDFIQRMDSESNGQSSYGLKVTRLELRDLGKRHLATYGETNVEGLIHSLNELALVIHKKAQFSVKLAALGLQRRYEFQTAREQLNQEGLPSGVYAVEERIKRNRQEQANQQR